MVMAVSQLMLNSSQFPYISVSKDGSIYVADSFNQRIRKITPDGIVNKIAGRDTVYHSSPYYVNYFEPGFSGDGGPALCTEFWGPGKATEGPDGYIYIADDGNYRIRRLSRILIGFTASDTVISEDGSELYRFNANGRHLSTVNAPHRNHYLHLQPRSIRSVNRSHRCRR